MRLLTFLALLLDMGKAEGGLTESMAYLRKFIEDVKAGLPEDAADYIGPVADALYEELNGKVPSLDLRAIIEEVISFVVAGAPLGKPDRHGGASI